MVRYLLKSSLKLQSFSSTKELRMKYTDFELYLMKEAIVLYKTEMQKQDLPKNSIVTKEFVTAVVDGILERIASEQFKREMNYTKRGPNDNRN